MKNDNDALERVSGKDGWHRVCLEARFCTGDRYIKQHYFCAALSLGQPGSHVRDGDHDYMVFCFAERMHAESFRSKFGGEILGGSGRASEFSQLEQTVSIPQASQGRSANVSSTKIRAHLCVNRNTTDA